MKKLIAIAALVFFAGTTIASELPDSKNVSSSPAASAKAEAVVLEGSIVDSQTQESLAGVTLEIVGTKTVVYTEFDENFSVADLVPGYYDIIIRYVSYQGHLIESVYLNRGLNTLPQIKMIPN
jgi:hypothetical protein